MFVGVLQVDLSLEKARSLKDKRQVVKSILDRVRSRFNVSAAEVDFLDLHQRAGLAFTAVSRDSAYVRGQMDTLLDHLKMHPVARVIDHQIEIF
ncbi:MAG: DUF503 domain-containing protein [Planctomycetota bacterium]